MLFFCWRCTRTVDTTGEGMSREIEFRGRCCTSGRWIFGHYVKHKARQPCPVDDGYGPDDILHYIFISEHADWNMPRRLRGIKVHPETVGQFSGFFAANDEKIYAGDVIARFVRDEKNAEPRRLGVFEVVYCKGGFRLKDKHAYEMGWDGCHIGDSFSQLDELKRDVPDKELFVEKLGNIHDNPELLKEFESEYRRFWEELKNQTRGK